MSSRTNIVRLAFVVLAVALFSGCSIRNYIPEGQYVLRKNVVETDHQVPRSERIAREEIAKYIKQRPSMDIWGIREWLYMKSDTNHTPRWLGGILRSLGTAPVLLDTTLTRKSADNIKAYVASRGFFGVEEEFSLSLNPSARTATATYSTFQGDPYRIANVNYLFEDNFIERIIENDSTEMLRPGEILDINRLGEERTRLSEKLRDNGYYDFSPSNIEFKVDTTIGGHKANVEMIVKRRQEGYDAQGELITANNSIYRLGRITILPDYDATRAATSPDYLRSLDTLSYEGLNIVYSGERPNLRPSMLRRIVRLQSGALYSDKRVSTTYDNLMRLDYVRSANMIFTPDQQGGMRPITFIGDHWSDTAETTEGVLDCEIRLAPALSQNYKVELEASTTSSFYGLATTLGYQNRNLFRGAELFDLSFTFGYEFLKVDDPTLNRNSVELGGRVGITFPTFLFPIDLDPASSLHAPQTRVEFSINDQNRRYYHRVLSNLTFGYNWADRDGNYYSIRPFDISLVKMNYVSQDFLDRLQNPYLKDSYTTQMMAGLSGSFVFGPQNITELRNYHNLRLNFATSGNLLSGINSLFGATKTNDHYTMFGIPYAQYVRADVSWAESIALGDDSSLAYRLYGGLIYPYGNSRHESLPADRLFYAGGINSMRGWTVRTLGPGSSAEVDSGYPSQFGNLRLEANAELRFPLGGIFDGALFVDAGNIWYTPDIQGTPEDATFKFGTFAEQIALNTGVGLRLNLNVLLLRLDWGVQLHNPNKPAGQRWVVSHFNFNNTALNFGIGYPF